MAALIECVPNFSEGRDPRTFTALLEALASVDAVTILKSEMDADHHRSVFTMVGPPAAVVESAFRGIERARDLIDLGRHRGVHPRIGAADVVPLVPLADSTLADCVEWAHQLGRRVWSQLGVPVYFYEAAATDPNRERLEEVRRGGFENPALPPDLGGPGLHPSAGACIIGARKYLIAYNINLDTNDVQIAKSIARRIRSSSGGMPHVKAIGVLLASRNVAQVSMNLTDFEQTPPHAVFERVEAEAGERGVRVLESEIIGLIPAKALELAAAHCLRISGFDHQTVLENRLAAIRLAHGTSTL